MSTRQKRDYTGGSGSEARETALSEAQRPPYRVKQVTVVVKTEDVLAREYLLDPGEFIMWHHHTLVSDHFYALEGAVRIETRGPAGSRDLHPGETMIVAPPTPHRVSNATARPCRFLLIQGVGRYDFIKEA